jgi:hypothetical protein
MTPGEAAALLDRLTACTPPAALPDVRPTVRILAARVCPATPFAASVDAGAAASNGRDFTFTAVLPLAVLVAAADALVSLRFTPQRVTLRILRQLAAALDAVPLVDTATISSACDTLVRLRNALPPPVRPLEPPQALRGPAPGGRSAGARGLVLLPAAQRAVPDTCGGELASEALGALGMLGDEMAGEPAPFEWVSSGAAASAVMPEAGDAATAAAARAVLGALRSAGGRSNRSELQQAAHEVHSGALVCGAVAAVTMLRGTVLKTPCIHVVPLRCVALLWPWPRR